MPISLNFVATQDQYVDGNTLGPSKQIKAIFFVVNNASVFAQVAKEDKATVPNWDLEEVPFQPGTGGYTAAVYGIRFRSAVAGTPAVITGTAYFIDDPVPFNYPSAQPGTITPGGGFSPPNKVTIVPNWGGILPGSVPTTANVWRVPDTAGVATTFKWTHAYARVENLGVGPAQFDIQTSPPGGVFTPTLLTSLVIPGGSYEFNVALAGTITSGTLMRMIIQALSQTGNFFVQLEGNT